MKERVKEAEPNNKVVCAIMADAPSKVVFCCCNVCFKFFAICGAVFILDSGIRYDVLFCFVM